MHTMAVDTYQRVLVDGVLVCEHLTIKEEEILRAIMAHSHVASKDYILTAVYGGQDEPELKIIDVFVTKIRAKLGSHRDAIRTMWGRGYCRNPEYELSPPEPPHVTVRVDSQLLSEVAFGCNETGEALVTRLLTAERERLWADDTSDVAEVA